MCTGLARAQVTYRGWPLSCSVYSIYSASSAQWPCQHTPAFMHARHVHSWWCADMCGLLLRLLILGFSCTAPSLLPLLLLCREACGILSTLQPGAYPAQEAAWLVGDAWRCGSMHARFGRHSQAAAFMEVRHSLAARKSGRGYLCCMRSA